MFNLVGGDLRRWSALALWLAAGASLAQGAEDLMSVEPELEEMDPAFARIPNPAFPSPEVHEVPVDRGLKVLRADLAPYFADAGPLAKAEAAFDQGRWAEARALFVGDSIPVRYMRAFAALKQEDHAFSAREFEALAGVYPALKDRCLILAGTSYEALKDWASAERMYEGVAAASRQKFDASLGMSRALRWLKNPAQAKKVLEVYAERPAPPWGRDVGAEALLALADVAAWKKDGKGEREALVKLWAAHPVAPAAARAEARLGDLSAVGTEALVTRAEALIEVHHNAQGMELLEPLLPGLKLPDALACRAHFAFGKAQRKQRLHPKAVATLQPVVKQCKDLDLKARAQFVMAFSKSVSEPRAAAVMYEALATSAPTHQYADDSLFFAADMWFRAGDPDRAMTRLGELVERYPTGDFAAEALFKRAWIRRSARAWDQALAELDTIEQRFVANDESYEIERARYWRARIFEARGDKDGAVSVLATLAVEHPATYYGLIARERLATLDAARARALTPQILAPAQAADPFPMYAGPLSDDPQFLSAIELLRLGFGELVPGEILSVDRSTLPVDALRLMVQLLALSGEQRAAHGMARLWLRRDLSGRVTAANRTFWEIAYPNAFRDLVVKHCEAAHQLDPDLLQALMREESALDPKAFSWAGAIGLCQLMPPTAAEVAAQLKLKYPTRAALLEPDLNIRLGSKYLADLLARAKGTRQYAIASYNAGEGAVGRWRKEHPEFELDEWVEEIPLTETRAYVKRVLRSYNTYRLLYGTPLSAPGAAP